jgi:hypothetical protein
MLQYHDSAPGNELYCLTGASGFGAKHYQLAVLTLLNTTTMMVSSVVPVAVVQNIITWRC